MKSYVMTPQQMQNAERRTIEELGIPSLVLMELAGNMTVADLKQRVIYPLDQRIVVFAGCGNNGGDGAVIARYLRLNGQTVHIFIVGNEQLSPDNQVNMDIASRLDIPIERISKLEDITRVEHILAHSGLIVDAIYGTGYRERESEFTDALFAAINNAEANTVAIDIPSGLDGSGKATRSFVKAAITYVIGAYKVVHMVREEHCGDLCPVSIGIPDQYLLDEVPGIWITRDSCRFPNRDHRAHKGMYGEVAVIAGTPGMAGAGILASHAALRSGAGYVCLYHHPALSYGTEIPELMISPVPCDDAGIPNTEQLNELIGEPEVIVIGPGMGQGEYCKRILDYMIKQKQTPLVLDADALNVLSKEPELISELRDRSAILTPHWGEFCRLAAISMEDLQNDPFGELTRYCERTGLCVLLKSHYSIYRDPHSLAFITAGNDGLATGGSGDVLSGIIASFIAQGFAPQIAGPNAAYLMGFTAESLIRDKDTAGIIPTDIINGLFTEIYRGSYKERRWRD